LKSMGRRGARQNCNRFRGGPLRKKMSWGRGFREDSTLGGGNPKNLRGSGIGKGSGGRLEGKGAHGSPIRHRTETLADHLERRHKQGNSKKEGSRKKKRPMTLPEKGYHIMEKGTKVEISFKGEGGGIIAGLRKDRGSHIILKVAEEEIERVNKRVRRMERVTSARRTKKKRFGCGR